MSGQGGQATPGAPGPPLRPGPTPSAAGQTPRRWPRAWAVRVGLRGNGGRADGRERGASVAGGPGPGGASPGSRGPSRAPVGLRSSGDLRGKQRTAVSAPDTQGPCQERPQAGLAGTAPWTDAGRRPPGQETRWRPASLHAPGVPLAPDDQGVGLVPSTGFPHPPPPRSRRCKPHRAGGGVHGASGTLGGCGTGEAGMSLVRGVPGVLESGDGSGAAS